MARISSIFAQHTLSAQQKLDLLIPANDVRSASAEPRKFADRAWNTLEPVVKQPTWPGNREVLNEPFKATPLNWEPSSFKGPGNNELLNSGQPLPPIGPGTSQILQNTQAGSLVGLQVLSWEMLLNETEYTFYKGLTGEFVPQNKLLSFAFLGDGSLRTSTSHTMAAHCGPVYMAGEVTFYLGKVQSWNNKSGTYAPKVDERFEKIKSILPFPSGKFSAV